MPTISVMMFATSRQIMRIINAPIFLWFLLALPAAPMTATLIAGTSSADGAPATEALLRPTGEFSARFLIVAMLISPLRILFPRSSFLNWMLDRRRYFGVAAFLYALAHTALYIFDMGTLTAVFGEFLALGIWTGWLAFFVFIPLAATSSDRAMHWLGMRWQLLQRGVYVAAVATLVHWIFVHNNPGVALTYFVPLALLETYRLWRHVAARNQRRLSA